WPNGGPWVLATTSTSVDWQLPAAALAAASTVRVAAIVFGAPQHPRELLLAGLATYLEARDGGADPLTIDEAADLVTTVARTHGLVLVVGVPGLLVPVGRAGWTVTDLAAAVSAPAVVVAGPGPDSTNHTTLALGALTARGIAATVVAIGPAPDASSDATEADDPTDDHAGLPVAPAGHIPADAADRPAEFDAAARAWLNPILHASAGRPRSDTPPPAPAPVAPRPATSGKRAVLLVAGAFVSMSLVACGVAFCDRTTTTEQTVQFRATVQAGPTGAAGRAIERPLTVPRPTVTRRVSEVCPENQGRVTPARPDRITTRRVNAAWKRIEDWLAAHAPRSRRSLRPPARAGAVDHLQKRMSVSFPPDLVASLRRHDGVTAGGFPLPFMHEPLPVGRIADEWLSTCAALTSVFTEDDLDWWNKAYVPFATAGDGGYLLVDQRPGSHGRVGEFYNETGVDFERWPGSVAELLERTARALETGRPFGNRYRPKVDKEGDLGWDFVR
ncbi:MAG TPA: SMI1/KNR4 family protein, partial [Actinoplanes sp.]